MIAVKQYADTRFVEAMQQRRQSTVSPADRWRSAEPCPVAYRYDTYRLDAETLRRKHAAWMRRNGHAR